MRANSAKVEKRLKQALAAIRKAYGTPADEDGATLFVSHHLDELDASFWEQHLDGASPEPLQVLALLVPSPHWKPEEDGIGSINFTLPDDVTDYVICVRFDANGAVQEISMES